MIPCKNCLIIPICRHRSYGDQLSKCDLLYEHLYTRVDGEQMMLVPHRKPNYDKEILKVYEIIKPTKWTLGPFRRARAIHKYRIIHYHEGKEAKDPFPHFP